MSWACRSCQWINTGVRCSNCTRGRRLAVHNVSLILGSGDGRPNLFTKSRGRGNKPMGEYSPSYQERLRAGPIIGRNQVQTYADGTPWG